jgi:hypothetical protein
VSEDDLVRELSCALAYRLEAQGHWKAVRELLPLMEALFLCQAALEAAFIEDFQGVPVEDERSLKKWCAVCEGPEDGHAPGCLRERALEAARAAMAIDA